MERTKVPEARGVGGAPPEVNGMPHFQPDYALQAYAANRPKFPNDELLLYSGQWIAWNADVTKVVASARSRREIRRLVRELNQDPQRCVIEQIPLLVPPKV